MEEYSLIRAILALGFVLGLVMLLGWAMRRWDVSKFTNKLQEGRRLRLREQLFLDPKRKAVILSCDDKEYLVILGMQGETVISLSQDSGFGIRDSGEKK